MRDIWAFLIVTLTVSGVAAVLLIVKWLLKDKLPPRWQFSAWLVVLLAVLIPVGSRYILFDWPLLVETFKSKLTGDYTVTKIIASIPMLPETVPSTVADWIFVIYFAGAVLLLVHYVFSYVRLRAFLKKGREATAPIREKIKSVEETYGLRCCKAVMVPNLESAFVCGVFRPILALPEDRDTDEKVLLHEMLHLKYRDAAWGWVICLFRCIHWCNPFLWYCANWAGDDLESLCDQRVLERLEGEQVREYGRILLSMANEKYARIPGTTSTANGGQNIRQRMETITRFKHYPKGMTLVSVCILIILMSSVAYGGTEVRNLEYHGALQMQSALAAARLTDCTTFAGAVDCYGKALLTNERIYRILCANDHEREQIAEEMVRQSQWEMPPSWDSGLSGSVDPSKGYFVYNVRQKSPEHYEALMVFQSSAQTQTEENMVIYTQNVAFRKENGRWIAEPLEEIQRLEVMKENLRWNCRALPAYRLVAEAEDFRLALNLQKTFEVDNQVETSGDSFIFPASARFDLKPNPNAEFDVVYPSNWATLTYVGENMDTVHQVGISYAPWPANQERPQLETPGAENAVSSGTQGDCWATETLHEGQNPVIDLGGGGYSEPFGDSWLTLPQRYAADLYINGELAAQLTVLPEEKAK